MPAASPRFTPATLRFLRALKRNNRREWFNAHRDDYEAHVRQPMTAIVERLAVDLRTFAPELVASPKLSMYRIYRDTRFSDDKKPYKTHVAAVFPTRGLAKHEGAGVYFHVAPDEVWIGGGMYSPQPPAAPRCPRAHRRTRQTASRHRRFAGIPPAGRPARGRTAQAGAARLFKGSQGSRVPEVPPVPRRP